MFDKRGAQACERGANISAATGVHARATYFPEIPAACEAFVPSQTRACPRFPPRNLNGKEGVDGSSPSEGFRNALQKGYVLTLLLPVQARERTRREH